MLWIENIENIHSTAFLQWFDFEIKFSLLGRWTLLVQERESPVFGSSTWSEIIFYIFDIKSFHLITNDDYPVHIFENKSYFEFFNKISSSESKQILHKQFGP